MEICIFNGNFFHVIHNYIPSNKLTFTLIQAALAWEDKSANRDAFEQKIKSLHKSAEIFVLPEMFTTGFSMNAGKLAEPMSGDTMNWMKRIAKENRIILTGSFIAAEENDGHTKFYNRLIWMLPTGDFGQYDKKHLFAYAEEDANYNAGTKRLIASVKGWKINLQICYDLRFPTWARQQPTEEKSAEYDVLIYVANWPEKRANAWRTLLQARAIENQCYVIGVNVVGKDGNGHQYRGGSMVVDPLGEILYEKLDEEDIHTITLDKDHLDDIRSRLPFLRDRDNFMLID